MFVRNKQVFNLSFVSSFQQLYQRLTQRKQNKRQPTIQIIKKMNSLSKKNSKTSLQEMYDLKNKVTDKIKDFSTNK